MRERGGDRDAGAAAVDRPHNIFAGDTLSGGMRVMVTPAGERFKKMRWYVFRSHSPSPNHRF